MKSEADTIPQPETSSTAQSTSGSDPGQGRRLRGDVALMTAAGIAEQIGAIGLMIALSRLLSVADYGGFRQLWLIQRSLVVLFMIGIPVSLQYYLPLVSPAFRARLVGRSMLALAGSGLVAAVAVYLLAEPIAELFDYPPLAGLLRIFCVYPMLVLPSQALRAALIEVGRSVRYAVFTLVDQVLTLILCIAIVAVTGELELLVILLVALGVVKLAAAVALTVLTLRQSPADHDPARDSVSLGRQLKFAASLSIATAIDAINLQLDKFMVAAFFGVEEFARYANGAFHVPVVSTVVSGFSVVLLPEYVRRQERGDTAGILALWHDSIRHTALLFVPMVVFLLIFAEGFVTIMFSETYVDSANIFRVYILALLPRITWYSYVLIALGKPKEPAIGSAIALVSNVLLNLVFIKTLGVIGPAVATVLSELIVAGYFLHRIASETSTPLRAVFPWAMLARVTILSCVVAAVVWPVLWSPWPALWPATATAMATLLVAFVLFAALGVAGLRITGLLTPEEWAWALRRLGIRKQPS